MSDGYLSLVGGGQTGGAVDGQVGGLGQSQQGDVVAAGAGLVVAGSQDDQSHVEILHDHRLVQSVELVFPQPD